MKNKSHIRTNQKTAAALRREVARLGGIIKAKNNADAARESLVSIMDENNAIKVTPDLLEANGWHIRDDGKMAIGHKGAFQFVFYKEISVVSFGGNYHANRIELRKPSITIGEVNNIMQIFGNPERLHKTNANPY